jgi:hypothetical protein
MHLTVRKGTDCIESQLGRHTSQIGSLYLASFRVCRRRLFWLGVKEDVIQSIYSKKKVLKARVARSHTNALNSEERDRLH